MVSSVWLDAVPLTRKLNSHISGFCIIFQRLQKHNVWLPAGKRQKTCSLAAKQPASKHAETLGRLPGGNELSVETQSKQQTNKQIQCMMHSRKTGTADLEPLTFSPSVAVAGRRVCTNMYLQTARGLDCSHWRAEFSVCWWSLKLNIFFSNCCNPQTLVSHLFKQTDEPQYDCTIWSLTSRHPAPWARINMHTTRTPPRKESPSAETP